MSYWTFERQWSELDSIMAEHGMDPKARPEEAQEWLRKQLALVQPVQNLRAELARLRRIEEAAKGLFAALDYITPTWRAETLYIDKDSDEVNWAWVALDRALRGEEEK